MYQKQGEYLAKFCGLLRIYELYKGKKIAAYLEAKAKLGKYSRSMMST